ncbi:OmpH family outer membrane protein [Aliiroseovarius sp. F20344]|uniref:OmpH family outer membrane protein n=1 Tax=Aliiroseovarius sp. F20344 TaxID=2926414 RepID=UPI001FF25591|nr:OmpH family outer membrane protein [Aliiroseovarius sp. F20344]
MAIAAGLAAVPLAGHAQQAETTSVSQIVTIDRQSLFSRTAYGRRVVETVKVEQSRLAKEARAAEAELAEEEKQLTEQRATMDPAAFRALADVFDNKVSDLRAEVEARGQAFAQVLEREQSEFFDRIGPILGDLVRELGAVVIIDRRAILLSTQNIDITDLAVERIDRELGDGLTAPQTQPEQTEDTPPVEAPAEDSEEN